jgi:hypothetical protein
LALTMDAFSPYVSTISSAQNVSSKRLDLGYDASLRSATLF